MLHLKVHMLKSLDRRCKKCQIFLNPPLYQADSGYASSNGSGFFRNMNEDTNVKECTAAMVLMNLSASPRDKWLDDYHNMLSLSTATSSEICSSPITPRPSPATSCSHLPLDEDEEPFKRTKRSSVIFECTWRGCYQRDSCQEVGFVLEHNRRSKVDIYNALSRGSSVTSVNTWDFRSLGLTQSETTRKNSTTQRLNRSAFVVVNS